jgi:hypothetical protein
VAPAGSRGALWLATQELVCGVGDTIMLFVGNAINLALAASVAGDPGADAGGVTQLF